MPTVKNKNNNNFIADVIIAPEIKSHSQDPFVQKKLAKAKKQLSKIKFPLDS
jgi:hypothetical protein